MTRFFIFLATIALSAACSKTASIANDSCPNNPELENFSGRSFKMGFTSWSYGPEMNDVASTYDFIHTNGDIYAEHIDDKIPWQAWMDDTKLPDEFSENIAFKVSKKPTDRDLLLSVSILNTLRTDLQEDFNGNTPAYNRINDRQIENAYVKHLEYLIEQFQPDYLVLGIEVNEIWINSNAKWADFKELMLNVHQRIKLTYPNLKVSQSVTLHNYYDPQVFGAEAYIEEISGFVNQMDFAAISFYPFFKGFHNAEDFQKAFDFLHDQVTKPIAFVETSHIAEDLSVPSLNIFIQGDECEQKAYLETLLLNARAQNYEFIIWWAHRDFDALLEIFPEDLQDLGKVWRDTGLLDESGTPRPAFEVWEKVLGL